MALPTPLTRSLRHPLTLYPALIGAGGTAAFTLFHAGIVAEAIAIGGLGIGATSFLVHALFRRDAFRAATLKKQTQQLLEEERKQRRQLERELELGHQISGCERLADQALQQLDRIAMSRKSLHSILRDKLNEGELTFSRYATSAEEILGSIETNLRAAGTRFKSLQSIDIDAAHEGIRRIKRQGERPEDQKEREAFEARVHLLTEETSRIRAILKNNEEAITQLDHTVVSVAGMKTGKSDAQDLGAAIRELEDLADRAKRFDIHKIS